MRRKTEEIVFVISEFENKFETSRCDFQHREGRWVAPDKFAGKNVQPFQNGIFSDLFFINWPRWLICGVKTTEKHNKKFCTKFYGPQSNLKFNDRSRPTFRSYDFQQ